MLETYEAILNQHFPGQLIALYEKTIRNYLESNVDKRYYVVACKAIKRLKAIIPNNDINYLVNELKENYKRRPALMELMNKI